MTEINSTIEKNWANTLALLQDEVTKPAYETWFAGLKLKGFDDVQNHLYIEAKKEIIVSQINERYRILLESLVSATFDRDYKVVVELAEEPMRDRTLFSKRTKDIPSTELANENYFNPRYNFDTFVVGGNNEYAYAAALAVAESPAKKYNPLFIYGGSGLGKTHLMYAIGKYALENHKRKKVLYVSSEMFTNDMVNALRNQQMDAFKRKYRNVDILLIDDIQFIEKKEQIQEEFFHTFNALYERNKQIVISSDRPPNKLTNLDERLTSRFLWSITADIQPPTFETRVAILRNKASYENIEITDDVNAVINLIAEKIKFNVRELEGALEKMIAFSSIMNREINISSAKEILSEYVTAADLRITPESIKTAVSKKYNVSIKDLDSPKRNKEFAHPRQIAMYLCKELTSSSLPKIGSSFGGRDHTTVMHAHKKIIGEIKEDPVLKEEIDELIAELNLD